MASRSHKVQEFCNRKLVRASLHDTYKLELVHNQMDDG